MSRKQRNRKTLKGQRKGAAHSRRLSRLALGIGLLLLIGIVAGVLVFQGRGEDQSGAPLSVLRTADFHSLAFSPDDPNIVFFGHHNGIMLSDDGGKTWRRLADQRNLDAMGLAIDPKNSRLVYLAGHRIFQVSQDGGSTWKPVANNLPDTDIHGFTMSPEDPQRLFAFVVGNGLFRSSDGGHTWTKLSAQLPNDVLALASSGGNPEILYAGSVQSGVLRSTDGGQNWAPAGKGFGSSGVVAIAVSPDSKTVYAGGDAGLFTSTDVGNSWTKLSFPGRSVAVLAISPSLPGRIMAISVAGNEEGLVYRSDDGGASWGN